MRVNGNKEKEEKKNLREMIDVQLLTLKMKRSKNQKSFKRVRGLFQKKIYHLLWLNPKSKEFSIKKMAVEGMYRKGVWDKAGWGRKERGERCREGGTEERTNPWRASKAATDTASCSGRPCYVIFHGSFPFTFSVQEPESPDLHEQRCASALSVSRDRNERSHDFLSCSFIVSFLSALFRFLITSLFSSDKLIIRSRVKVVKRSVTRWFLKLLFLLEFSLWKNVLITYIRWSKMTRMRMQGRHCFYVIRIEYDCV